MVPALIAAGAGIEVADDDGTTPLMWAAYLSRAEVVAELLAAGARVDARDRYGRTPLHLASERSDVIVVRALLDAGSDVDAQDETGRTALMIAALVTQIPNLEALIRGGAKPSAIDNQGQTSLDYAVERGITKKTRLAVRLLRRAGAISGKSVGAYQSPTRTPISRVTTHKTRRSPARSVRSRSRTAATPKTTQDLPLLPAYRRDRVV